MELPAMLPGQAAAARPPSANPDSLRAWRRQLAIGVAGFAALLVASWIATLAIARGLSDANQIGYLSADLAVLLPLSLLALAGLLREAPWAGAALLSFLGAAGYAAAHLCSYLIHESFLSVPPAAYAGILVSVLALLASFAVREHRLAGGRGPGAESERR